MKYTYYVDNIPLLHIAEFAARCHINHTTVRDMMKRVEKGEVGGQRWRRPLKYFRDGSTLFIPLSELYSYPIISGTTCYHITPEGKKVMCVECTMGEGCEKMHEGLRAPCPKGDDDVA